MKRDCKTCKFAEYSSDKRTSGKNVFVAHGKFTSCMYTGGKNMVIQNGSLNCSAYKQISSV